MPEGDTIYRAARALRAALQGRTITAARTRAPRVSARGVTRLVGQTVEAVESRGKHLLVWFAPSDLALHTHLRLSGSWHLYRGGERWRKPEHLATIVLEAGDRTAVCFSAPVCELLSRGEVVRHPVLAGLGPDALAEHPDLQQAEERLAACGERTIAEALLDQSVLAGVGNVYKSEVLFLHGVDPWTPVTALSDTVRAQLLATAVRLLRQNAAPGSGARVTTGNALGGQRLFVYGRARHPCRRCSTPIRMARQGEHARVTYWCPRCQPPVTAGGRRGGKSATPRRIRRGVEGEVGGC